MQVKNIDAKTAQYWLDKQNAILIDVREPSEYAVQNIAEAELHPLSSLQALNIKAAHKKIIVHCQKGSRGLKACNKLLEQNPSLEVYNLEGGIEAWEQAGLPTVKAKRKVISLMRQVHLTVGLGVLIFCLLAFFINPFFVWGAMFFGAGLVFSAITDWCGMARLLAKMPWN